MTLNLTQPPKGVTSAWGVAVHLRAHALTVVEGPRGLDVTWEPEARLEVEFPNVVRGDHGGESLICRYPIEISPPGVHNAIARDGLNQFVQPDRVELEAVPARWPADPLLERLTRFELDEDDIPRDLGQLPQSEWSTWIMGAMENHRDLWPREMATVMSRDARLIDEGECEVAVGDRHAYVSLGCRDQRFLVLYAEDGERSLTVYEVHHDDYCPADADELWEFVSQDIDEWIQRAANVEYQYQHDHGWRFRIGPDEDWKDV